MRGLYRRRGSPNWWVRYADPNGRIVKGKHWHEREDTGQEGTGQEASPGGRG